MTSTDKMNTAVEKAVLGVWELRWILIMGCLIAMLGMGARSSFGLFTEPVTQEMGWPYAVYGQALSLQNLMWGVLGTFAAIAADRRGPMPVIMVGSILYATGVIGMSMTTSAAMVQVFMGFIAGAGISATGFSLVAISFSKLVPPEQRTWAMGLGTAAASFGQFSVGLPVGLLIPEDGSGWRQVMFGIGCLTLLIFVMAFAFRKAGILAISQNHLLPRPMKILVCGRRSSAPFRTAAICYCSLAFLSVASTLPSYTFTCPAI